MFNHFHPYEPFLFKGMTKLIVGTIPPPRFTQRQLKPGDVDFCYGSRDGQLWRILDRLFGLGLVYETTERAVEQRKAFLYKQGIGICDIVDSAKRIKIDASDLGMQEVKLRNLLGYLKEYNAVETLLFTGGNSKNGPEYFFRRHLKEHNLSLELVSPTVPRIHQFQLKNGKAEPRIIRTISLTAPSGAANRAVGSLEEYKERKKANPAYNTRDFRVDQYREFF